MLKNLTRRKIYHVMVGGDTGGNLGISRVVSEADRIGRFMGKSLYCNFHGRGKVNRREYVKKCHKRK